MDRRIAMKPLLALLGFVLASTPLPATAEKSGDFIYTPVDDSTATITDYTGPGGAVIIPATIDGLLVTGIGDYGFSDCGGLTSITLPASVSSIGDRAFSSCGLIAIDVDAANPV